MEMTQAESAALYVRLTRHLLLPGRYDDAVMLLGLDAKFLPGQGAAPAALAKAIFDQLKLRVPPELEVLAAMIAEWEASSGRGSVPVEGAGKAHRPPPEVGVTEQVSVLSNQIIIFIIISYILISSSLIAMGQTAPAVVLLIVLLVAAASLEACAILTRAPRSISAMEFSSVARDARANYAAKGLLRPPAGVAA